MVVGVDVDVDARCGCPALLPRAFALTRAPCVAARASLLCPGLAPCLRLLLRLLCVRLCVCSLALCRAQHILRAVQTLEARAQTVSAAGEAAWFARWTAVPEPVASLTCAPSSWSCPRSLLPVFP